MEDDLYIVLKIRSKESKIKILIIQNENEDEKNFFARKLGKLWENLRGANKLEHKLEHWGTIHNLYMGDERIKALKESHPKIKQLLDLEDTWAVRMLICKESNGEVRRMLYDKTSRKEDRIMLSLEQLKELKVRKVPYDKLSKLLRTCDQYDPNRRIRKITNP